MMNTKGKQQHTTERQKSRDYSKRKNELYDGRTVQNAPTPRSSKKSSLAQIYVHKNTLVGQYSLTLFIWLSISSDNLNDCINPSHRVHDYQNWESKTRIEY